MTDSGTYCCKQYLTNFLFCFRCHYKDNRNIGPNTQENTGKVKYEFTSNKYAHG